MADKPNRKRQYIAGTNEIATVAFAIGIAIVLNALASQIPARIDMTENQIYTLSEASREAVQDLDQPVEVRAYISQDLPAPANNLARRVSDLLTEYRAASNKNLTFQIISPGDDKQAEKNAKADGCQKVAIGKSSKDQFSMRAVYKCVAFLKGGEREVIKDLKVRGRRSRGNFEYEFTKALLNLQNTDPRTLAFAAGFGGPADKRGFIRKIKPTFQKLYGDLIEVQKVDLSGKNPSIPDKVDGLVLMNPSKKFTEKAKYQIDQFLQRGGSVGWFQSATGKNKQMQQKLQQQLGRNQMPSFRQPLEPGLRDFFKEYGVHLRKDLVLDRKNAATSMTLTSRGLARLSQPATFSMSDIDKSLPFTRDLTTLALPAPSSIQVQPSILENQDVKVHKVVRTADTAVRRPEAPKSLKTKELMKANPNEKPGPFTVVAALQGNIPSYYDEHQPPKGVESQDKKQKSSSPGRLLVVGSGNFFQPQKKIGYTRRYARLGGQFFISSLEWLAQDTSLTEIRGKSLPRLVSDVSYEKKRTIQFINIAGVPLVFALLGVLMYYLRRKRKSILSEVL